MTKQSFAKASKRRTVRGPARLRMATVATAIALASLSACAAKDSPEALLDKARQSIAADEPRTAEIHLKNLLQQSDNGEARYLLGSLAESGGDVATAEKEYRRAFELGYSRDRTLPALMRSLLALGQSQKVLDLSHDMKLDSPAAKADALTSAGHALLRLGKRDEARRTFDEALAADKDSVSAQVAVATLEAATDRGAARKRVDAVLAKNPQAVDALSLRVDLDLVDGQREAARKTLQELAKLAPRRPDVPARLAGIAIEEGELDTARKHQAELARLAPNNVLTHHLKAVIEARSGQIAAARDSVGEALRRAPDYLPSIALAAAVHLQLNELEQAERHARRLVDRQPTALHGYRLLGSTYLKMNAPERALETVRRPLDRGATDAMLFAIAGEAALKSNDPESAEKYFEQATKLDPKDSRKLTGLAMSNLAGGDRTTAIDQLEAAVELDSRSLQADFVLISTLTREGKFDEALAAVERAKQKAPNSPIPEMLRGGVFLAKKDAAAARRAWEQALALDPQHFPAVSNLSNDDIRNGRRDEARKRYEDFAAANPKNAQAWVALAQLAVIERSPRARVLELLQKARDADPTSPMPVLATARYMMETDTAAEAVPLLQQAHNSNPDDVQILDTLAQAQLRSNQRGQAIATWERLLRTNPRAWSALMRIGEVHRAEGKHDLALASFVKAAEIAPNAIEPQVAMAGTMHALGRKDEARRLADRLRTSKEHAVAGSVLQGDLSAADGDWKAAADNYRRAFDQQTSIPAGTKLHRALLSAGQPKEADAMLAAWLRSEPENLALRMYAGEYEISQKRWRQAWDHYEAIVDAQPNNVLALNNGAWALHELKDPRAAGIAKRAWEAAPRHPAVLDTYGVILSTAGDPKGLELLREAVAAAPKNPQLRLHLAEALLRAGDKEAARSEVSTVLESARQGPVAEAAKALQAKL